ncbi:MAG: hypothetical protein ACKOA8_19770 [Deltaproteobacteria bacterium]
MKQKQLLVLGGVCAVVLMLIMLKTRSQVATVQSENALSQSPVSAIPPSSGSAEIAAIPTPQLMSPQQVVEWEKKDLALRNANMTTLSLPKEGEDSVLNIELKVKMGCQPGDADAIAMDLKAAPENRLLATLEGMSQGTKSFSWEVPKEFLSSGVTRTQFKIKASKDPIQLGFYLCTSKGGNSCQNKKIKDINEIFNEHLLAKKDAGKEERVIFYQYFLLDENGLSLFEKSPQGKQPFDEIKKMSQERKFQGQRVEAGIDKAQEAIETLRSLPVIFQKDTLILELPKYDVAACAKPENEKAAQKGKPE